MIGHLRGVLREKRPNLVLMDVHGVGYLIHIPLSTFYKLPEVGNETNLLIHTHVREDALALYGFHTAREKELFELLLGISGVGPRLAVAVLSGMSVEELIPAIRKNDLVRLTNIPGVGRKTAERMVVELRDKLLGPELAEGPARPTGIEEDVVSALVNLGYDRRAANRAVEEASRSGDKTKEFEPLLKHSLQRLASGGRRK